MLTELTTISIIFSSFCLTDRLLTKYTKLDGIYYLLHFVHNGIIVYLTYYDVVNTLFNFESIFTSTKNVQALEFVFALHLYHLALYWQKFRFDDWLHHILMIGIALPIGTFVESRSLMGYNLFFTTGLPGGIDYFLLFLTRNNWLNKNYEKEINAWLNTWIRSPGCISHVVLTLAYSSIITPTYSTNWWLSILVASLTFWNGQYFMRQIVENNITVQLKY
jgi:hypothetical protein